MYARAFLVLSVVLSTDPFFPGGARTSLSFDFFHFTIIDGFSHAFIGGHGWKCAHLVSCMTLRESS